MLNAGIERTLPDLVACDFEVVDRFLADAERHRRVSLPRPMPKFQFKRKAFGSLL